MLRDGLRGLSCGESFGHGQLEEFQKFLLPSIGGLVVQEIDVLCLPVLWADDLESDINETAIGAPDAFQARLNGIRKAAADDLFGNFLRNVPDEAARATCHVPRRSP